MLAAGDVLPAASVALTAKAWPVVCGGCSVMLNRPSAPAMAVPSNAPPGPRTETVDPGSARPVRVAPWASTARLVGASGAVRSGATTAPGAETLPAASVRVTCRFWLSSCAGVSTTSKAPLAPTTPLPITLPAASRTLTVVPGSPRPERRVPSADTASATGASGGVVSVPSTTGAAIPAAADVLPAASSAVTCNAWPAVCAGCRVTLNTPSAPAVAEPSSTPSAPLTDTVEPGSARPVSVVPWASIASSVGASGAVASGAVTMPGADTLPAASVKVTCRFSLLIWGALSATSKLPSAPTVPVPSRLPAASRMFTIAPASPRPDRRRPSGETSRSMGVAGAVVSGTAPPPPPPPPLPPPTAAAPPPTPSNPRPAMAHVGMASPAVPMPATSSSREATSLKVKPVNAWASYSACQRVPSSPTNTMSLPTPA